jgi:uncharacterized protein involved in exopolysaccharide biosynthesis
MVAPEFGKLTIGLVLEYCLENFKKLILIALAGGILGVLISFLWPKEYLSKTTLVTTSNYSDFGNIAGLASLTGFNINSGSQSLISPNLYPLISKNISFQLELLNHELDSASGLTYKGHLEGKKSNPLSWLKSNTIGLYGKIKKKTMDKERLPTQTKDPASPIQISYKEQDLIEKLSTAINIIWNDREQYIEIKVIDQDPKVAAAITEFTKNKLEQVLIKAETEKTKSFLSFINKEYQQKEEEYMRIQEDLSIFLDQNKELSSNTAQLERRKLEQLSSLSYSVFQEIASQKAQAEIEYQKQLPIFTVIEQIKVPLDKLNPNRLFWLIGFSLLADLIWLVMKLPTMVKRAND